MVSKVGGLVDTVSGYKDGAGTEGATGFFINTFSENGIYNALDKALTVFEDKKTWNKLVRNAMQQDHSWDKSSRDYMVLYQKTLTR